MADAAKPADATESGSPPKSPQSVPKSPLSGGAQAAYAAGSENQNLLTLLKSESGNEAFNAFLTKKFTQHHLTFWWEVEKFKEETDEEKKLEIAKFMYDTYIKVGTKNQVNIYTPLRDKIQKTICENGSPEQNVFDEAQKVVWDMFKGNFYRSFLKTEEYTTWKTGYDQAEADAAAKAAKKSSACTIL